MVPIRRLLAGLKALVGGHRAEQELDEELRAYLDTSVEAKIRAGMDGTDARRAARVEIGSLEAVKDYVRDVSWETRLEGFWRDVRYAARTLRKAPQQQSSRWLWVSARTRRCSRSSIRSSCDSCRSTTRANSFQW